MKSVRIFTALTFAAAAFCQDSLTPDAFASQEFDVVIVGGGTAGLVLANRLTEHDLTVGVVDAGHYNTSGDPIIDIPYGPSIYLQNASAVALGNPDYDWMFQSIDQPQLGPGRFIHYARGKVLGGSSAVNDMAWGRGDNLDYNAWSSVFQNDGWNFDILLPYFERAANWTSPDNSTPLFAGTTPADFVGLASVQGRSGHVQVRYDTYLNPIDSAMAEASAALGYPPNSNPDDGHNVYIPLAGVGGSVDIRTGKRSYAAAGYYNATVRARENLSVMQYALATRLVWDNSTLNSGNLMAKGVEFIVDGKTYVVNAKREVIVSAGSLKTPQFLELSGVGNATILEAAGVPVVLDLPAVGENLQDQPLTSTDYIVNDNVSTLDRLRWDEAYYQEQKAIYDNDHTGPFSWTGSVIGNWPAQSLFTGDEYEALRARLEQQISEIELTPLQEVSYNYTLRLLDARSSFIQPVFLSYGGLVSQAQNGVGYETMAVWNLREFSRGYVHINTSDPQASPVIDPKFMSFEWDLAIQTAATRFFDNMTTAQPAASFVKQRNTPNNTIQTDEQWTQFVLDTVASVNHPIGTCPMAPKEMGGVVDSHLRVYGLANVRVVDASIMPLTISAAPQQTVYAIAERAADIILQDLGII